MDKEILEKINSEVQAVLDKYGVTFQIVQGISYMPVEKKIEPEIISPYESNKETE